MATRTIEDVFGPVGAAIRRQNYSSMRAARNDIHRLAFAELRDVSNHDMHLIHACLKVILSEMCLADAINEEAEHANHD